MRKVVAQKYHAEKKVSKVNSRMQRERRKLRLVMASMRGNPEVSQRNETNTREFHLKYTCNLLFNHLGILIVYNTVHACPFSLF